MGLLCARPTNTPIQTHKTIHKNLLINIFLASYIFLDIKRGEK
jgi:hypothetical protein